LADAQLAAVIGAQVVALETPRAPRRQIILWPAYPIISG
jgi:hypothetical protein